MMSAMEQSLLMMVVVIDALFLLSSLNRLYLVGYLKLFPIDNTIHRHPIRNANDQRDFLQKQRIMTNSYLDK